MANSVDRTKSIDERIKFLSECADLYESSESPISDKDYDDEYYELQDLVPDDPFFDKVGGLDVGDAYGKRVTHVHVMGSLNKSRNVHEFLEWLKNTFGSSNTPQFTLQYKIDGLSLGLIYSNGEFKSAVTRGDGVSGIDVTANARHIIGVPQTISCKEDVEIRGECYKDRQDFLKNWVGIFANPRNMAAGAVNQKDPLETKKKGVSFVGYEIVRKDFKTEKDKIDFLENCGFETLKDSTRFIKLTSDHRQIAAAVKKFMDDIDRPNLPYDIDGIVVKPVDCVFAKNMGTSAGGKRPKAFRAVKFPTEKKTTILEGIEWSMGRTGALTPVGLLKPVQLAGTTVRRVSLHNLREMARIKLLNLGAVVVMEKAGDIIPKVVKVEKDGTGERIKAPVGCPSCGDLLEWDDNHVTKWCHNDSCPIKLDERIEHWFKVIGVKGIGSGIIGKLTGGNLAWDGRPIIKRLSDMYYMLHNDRKTDHPFRKYQYLKDEFGEKAYQNIVDSVTSVKEIPMDKFIQALGIGQIGTMAKDLIAIAPTPADIDNLTVDDIVALDGFAEKKARMFIDGWKNDRKEIGRLLGCVDIVQKKLASNKLDGQKFCFTGSFSNPSRKEMEQMVEDNGGKKSSVSKNLTALVSDGEIDGGKVQKAKSLGVDILDQQGFLDLLK